MVGPIERRDARCGAERRKPPGRHGSVTLRVAIEPLAGFAAEAIRAHELLLDRRWPEARRPPGRLEQPARGGEVHVDADQVHQREGAHREACRDERQVDRLDRRDAGAQQPQRLERERAVHPIDDEPR